MRAGALTLLFAAGCANAAPSGWLAQSPDGRWRARVTTSEAGEALLLDDALVGTFRGVAVAHARWAPDGLVVPVQRGARWHVFAHGALGPAHDAVGELLVREGRVAYAALDSDGWRVFVDGEPGPTHQTLLSGSLRLEAHHVAYTAREADGVHAVIDGRRGPAHRYVDRLELVGKGESVLYVAYDDEGAQLVVDGAPGPRFESVHQLAFATTSTRWAAIAQRGDALILVRDGTSAPLPNGASGLVLSEDGARVAWTETNADGVGVRVDGALVGRHLDVTHLAFVPRRLAPIYVARTERGLRVVHDGVPGPRFDAVDPPVSNAAGRWAYVGHRAAGSAVVVDGRAVFRGAFAGALVLAARGDRWACVVREAARRYVLTPEARTPIPRPFVDTLVLDARGQHWAIAVADTERRELRVLVDGQDAAPLPMEEVAAALRVGREGEGTTRALVAAALARHQQ